MPKTTHCRACFDIIDPEVAKCSILSDKVKKHAAKSLGEILSECSGLCLEPDVIENGVICPSCKQSLLSCYKFRKRVVETDEKFKELDVPEALPVLIKLEEVKLEGVETWDSEIRNDDDDFQYEEKENYSEVYEKKPLKKKAAKLEKVKRVRHREEPRRRRYLDPQRKENLKKYKRNNEGLYECPYDNCPGLFQNMGHLEMHLERTHPDTDQKSFPCENCGEEFPTLLLHRRHIFKYHTPRPYKCDICGNDYPYIDSIRSHMTIHMTRTKREKAKCACTICGKVYVCKANMLRHRKAVHFPKELIPKPYVCNVCGSAWASKSKMRAHMQNHENPEYFCDMCSKGFSRKGSLSLHMQTHMSERPFFCDMCGKTYKTKYQLRDHQIAHKEERTLKCSMCPATFKMQNSLRSHEIHVHISTGPVACHICGKLCKNKSSIKSHLVLHRAKDINCPHCDKTYKIMDTLKRHIQRVHMGLKKRHECSICLKNLWSRKHIADHILEAHKSVMAELGKTADELVRKYWTSDPSGANLGEVPPKGIIGRPVTV